MRCNDCGELRDPWGKRCESCSKEVKALTDVVQLHLYQHFGFKGYGNLLRLVLLNASEMLLKNVLISVRAVYSEHLKSEAGTMELDVVSQASSGICKLEKVYLTIVPELLGALSLTVNLSFLDEDGNSYLMSGNINTWVAERGEKLQALEQQISLYVDRSVRGASGSEQYAVDVAGNENFQISAPVIDPALMRELAWFGCAEELLPGQTTRLRMSLNEYKEKERNYRELRIGEVVGRYRILEHIGTGGIGKVWEVCDENLRNDARLALKVLNKESYNNPQARKSFLLEASRGMHFEHPGVTRTVDTIEEPGLMGFLSHYYRGMTLRKVMEERLNELGWAEGLIARPLFRLEEFANILVRICDAVDYVHTVHKLCHLDLKPENVIIRRPEALGTLQSADVVVMDFGLSKSLDRKTRLSVYSSGGTQAYMAPEQLEKQNYLPVGTWTDVYSMGLMLRECCAGTTKFIKSTYSLSTRWPRQIPQELDALIDKATEEAPLSRIQSMKEFADILRPYLLEEALDVEEREAKERAKLEEKLRAVEAEAAWVRQQQQAEVEAAWVRQQKAEAEAARLRQQQAEAEAAWVRQQQAEAEAAWVRQQQAEVEAARVRQQQAEAEAARLRQQQAEAEAARVRQQKAEVEAARVRQQKAEAEAARVRQQQAEAAGLRQQKAEAEAARVRQKQQAEAEAKPVLDVLVQLDEINIKHGKGASLKYWVLGGVLVSMLLLLFLWFSMPTECKSGEVRACGTDVGECEKGQEKCVDSKWSRVCEGGRKAKAEVCNGKDDDCDGVIDNNAQCARGQVCRRGECMTIECVDGEKRACGTDVGECEKGQERCAGGKWSGVCEGGRKARAEVCNGKDDDCDGVIDNNAQCARGQVCRRGECMTIECVDGEKRACGTDVGECEKGQERCAGGKWSGVCEGGRNARAEVCNGKDDDCDGLIDNNARCSSGQVCIKGKCVKKSYGDEVGIRAGSFWMGSPENEPGRRSNERRRRVGLTRAFYMLRYEVTQGQFRRLMGYNPSFFSKCGANCPVEQVNWHEACAYANALSRSRGMEECYDCKGSGRGVRCDAKMQYRGSNYYNCSGYRLPTEAEWEYAARAGTSTAFYSGGITHTDCSPLDPNLDKIGWYCGNSESKTQHPVGRKQANAWGLYDMAGNVWEWVYDCYQDSYSGLTGKDPVNDRTGSERVLRGGSWYNFARYVRAAVRYERSPAYSDYDVGFRLLRSLSSN